MDRRIDAGPLLVGAAALLLVIALFLDWFGGGGDAVNAWRAFETLDLVLVATAAAAVAAAFGRLDSRVLLGAALVAVVVVVSQLLDPPPVAQGAERELGAWLGLAAALGLLAGAALVAARIAVTVDVQGRERRHRVAAVDKRKAGETPAMRGSGGDEPAVDRFAPDTAVRLGSRPADSDETQPFAAPGDQAR